MKQNGTAIIVVAALAILLAFSGCAQQQITGEKTSFSLRVTDSSGEAVSEKLLETSTGQTVFDALKENKINMKYEDYSIGPFITGIEGVSPQSGEYMAVYVNGKYADSGVGDLKIIGGENIEFRVEKIEGYGFS
ncbi:MAG: DUF4430 domain-containing protein [archaeon]